MFRQFSFLIFCLLVLSSLSTASFLSWITGSNKESPNTPPLDPRIPVNIPVNPYPKETGECAHWGNVLPQYSSVDPTYAAVGLSVPGGTLIGSYSRAPVGSIVAVTNMKNGNTVKVRVVPPQTVPIAGRLMDMSPAAFTQVALLNEGVFLCSINVIQTPRQAEMQTLPSHTFENGVRNPGLSPSPYYVSTRLPNVGGLGSLEYLARNVNGNGY